MSNGSRCMEERSENKIYEYTAIFVTIIIIFVLLCYRVCARFFFLFKFYFAQVLERTHIKCENGWTWTWSQCNGSNQNNHVCRYERINSS